MKCASIKRNSRIAQEGFSLLEVLIAMTILTFISLAIYQGTAATFIQRDKLLSESDFYSGIRLAMSVVDRDIQHIYSPTLLMPDSKASPTPNSGTGAPPPFGAPPNSGAAAEEDLSWLQGDLAVSSDFWTAAIHKTGIRASRFQGTSESLSFISASHIRVYKGSAETEFIKVTYKLGKDTAEEAIPDTLILTRLISWDVFATDDGKETTKKTYPLVGGLKKVTFEYLNPETNFWVKSWDSDSATPKNSLPARIRISFEAVGQHRLQFDGVYDFKPEIPLEGLSATF